MSVEAFFEAIGEGDFETVERMMMGDPTLPNTPDDNGVTPLLFALYARQGDIAGYLAGLAGPLTLFEAAALGNTDRMQVLLDRGDGDIDELAEDGFFPLGLASFFGQASAVAWLIARGADVAQVASNPMQIQPLHAAVASGDGDASLVMARMLLDAGADANAEQRGGYRPLHQAAARGLSDLAVLLIDNGAEPQVMADDGKTPADLARENDFETLAEHMEQL